MGLYWQLTLSSARNDGKQSNRPNGRVFPLPAFRLLSYKILYKTYFNSFNVLLSGFDMATDYMWETHNKGKLWKDIKHKYEEKEE